MHLILKFNPCLCVKIKQRSFICGRNLLLVGEFNTHTVFYWKYRGKLCCEIPVGRKSSFNGWYGNKEMQ